MADGRRRRQDARSGASGLARLRRSTDQTSSVESSTEPSPIAPSQRRRFRFPSPPAPVAAAIAGAVSGLVAVLLVLLAERGCDMVRGRPSCGGVGLFLLIAIVVICLLLGALLMRLLHVRDPGLVAFFGVSLATMFIMVFLIDRVFSGWMILVVPLLAAATFALSALLTQALENSREPTYDAEPYTRTDADVRAAEKRLDVPARDDVTDLPRYAPVEDRAAPGAAGSSVGDDATLVTPSRGASSRARGRHAAPVAPTPDEADTSVAADDRPSPGRRVAR